MRPLIATFMEPVTGQAEVSSYDERLAVSLDRSGQPVVLRQGVETTTKVVKETSDDLHPWPGGETRTFVEKETADDDRVWALGTETRTLNEDPDEHRQSLEGSNAMPPADDPVVGVVSF
jgi:hypothetical protein